MTIESAFRSELNAGFAADANLSGLTVPVFAHQAPQSTDLPYAVYRLESIDIDNRLNITDTALTQVYIALSVYSDTVENRAKIVDSVKSQMHGFTGAMGTEALNIRNSSLVNLSTFNEADLVGTDSQIYRATMDLLITYNWST